MAIFTEQMEKLTSELLTARQERGAFVGDMQQQTHTIVAEAQTFMRVLGQELKSKAASLHKDMAEFNSERIQAAKAQAQECREQIQTKRKDLLEMLAKDREQRQQQVAAARKDVAADLRQAAKVWQRVFQDGAPTNGAMKGKAKVAAGATATQAKPAPKADEPIKTHEHDRAPRAEPHQHAQGPDHGQHAKKDMGHTQNHGRSHTAEPKKANHDGPHGHQGGKEKHSHSK